MELTLDAHIDHHATIKFEDEVQRAMLLAPYVGKKVTVTVKQRRKRRTNPQNKYYWKVVVGTIAGFTGDEPERIHDALRLKFLREPAVVEGGLDYIGRTSSMTTAEFNDYVERIRVWAFESFNIYLPKPDETEI